MATTKLFRDLAGWEEFVEKYRYIVVAIPPYDKEFRDRVCEELRTRFKVSIIVPDDRAFHGCKSISELWVEEQREKILTEMICFSTELPAYGLLNVADIDITKRLNAKRVLSGIKALDTALGGFVGGEVTVWTAKRGEGKTTILGQMIVEALNQVRKVCAYSGEMPKEQFKIGLLQQAAGLHHVVRRDDPRSQRIFFDVPKDVSDVIDGWWDKRLFLTDIQYAGAHEEDNIMRVFEYANRAYGCDVFVVDNIMTAELKQSSMNDYWRAQSAFTGRLVAFAKRFDVHVHLVAHPRKVDKRSGLDADDVGGSGDITNRVDNVIKVERVSEEKKTEYGCSTILTILKNREFGARAQVNLEYNEPSRRLYQVGSSPAKQYSWEPIYRDRVQQKRKEQ